MSPPKFRVYRAQQRPDPDTSSSEAEMGQAELGAADKLSIYSLLEESGVFAHRPLGKRGLAGPVLGHKSCLHLAPGPRSGSRAGPQQPALPAQPHHHLPQLLESSERPPTPTPAHVGWGPVAR